ncbi:MAG: SCP2 sterol-binding domain-containing protein [Magnetococcales bacterium]|nr:SCP2 sterol-binding domain-containing protein [Magnetococcales bacterium]
MFNKLLLSPLKLIPQPATAVSLSVVLNIFFDRYPDLKKQLSELSGKIFEFAVEDMGESYYMMVDDQGGVTVHTYCDNISHVTMSGSINAFLSLLFQTTDPDSLFFSRALSLSGETDTGLHFKNILNNVDINWEEELSSLFGAVAARTLMSMARQVQIAGEKSKEKVESEIEQWMDEQNLPLKEKFDDFSEQIDELQKRTEQLEKTISRLDKKIALSRPKNTAKSTPALKLTTKSTPSQSKSTREPAKA